MVEGRRRRSSTGPDEQKQPRSAKRRSSSRRETLEAGSAEALEAQVGTAQQQRRETVGGAELDSLEAWVAGGTSSMVVDNDDTISSPLWDTRLGGIDEANDDTVDEADLARARSALEEQRQLVVAPDSASSRGRKNEEGVERREWGREAGREAVNELLGTPPRRTALTATSMISSGGSQQGDEPTRTGLERVSAAAHVPATLRRASHLLAPAAIVEEAGTPEPTPPRDVMMSPRRPLVTTLPKSCLSSARKKKKPSAASPNVTFCRSSRVATFEQDDPPSTLTPHAPAEELYDVDSAEKRVLERDNTTEGFPVVDQRTLANSATLAQWQIETASPMNAGGSPRRLSQRFSLDEDEDDEEQYSMELTQSNFPRTEKQLTPIDEEEKELALSTASFSSSSGGSQRRRREDETVALEPSLGALLAGYSPSVGEQSEREDSPLPSDNSKRRRRSSSSRGSAASLNNDMTVQLETDLGAMLENNIDDDEEEVRLALFESLRLDEATSSDAAWRLTSDEQGGADDVLFEETARAREVECSRRLVSAVEAQCADLLTKLHYCSLAPRFSALLTEGPEKEACLADAREAKERSLKKQGRRSLLHAARGDLARALRSDVAEARARAAALSEQLGPLQRHCEAATDLDAAATNLRAAATTALDRRCETLRREVASAKAKVREAHKRRKPTTTRKKSVSSERRPGLLRLAPGLHSYRMLSEGVIVEMEHPLFGAWLRLQLAISAQHKPRLLVTRLTPKKEDENLVKKSSLAVLLLQKGPSDWIHPAASTASSSFDLTLGSEEEGPRALARAEWFAWRLERLSREVYTIESRHETQLSWATSVCLLTVELTSLRFKALLKVELEVRRGYPDLVDSDRARDDSLVQLRIAVNGPDSAGARAAALSALLRSSLCELVSAADEPPALVARSTQDGTLLRILNTLVLAIN